MLVGYERIGILWDMALQLSMEQARALGILARAGITEPAGKAAAVPAKGQTPARMALDAALAPRRSAKGGRIRRVEPPTGVAPEVVSFNVDHPPRTKQRARTQIDKKAVVQAFLQARGSVREFARLLAAVPHRSFTPKSTGDFENAVAEAARAAMAGREPFRVPVEIEVAFTFEGDSGLWPTDVTDADLDNLEKAVLDGLNKVAYSDDRLVVRKSGVKQCGPVPGVRVRVIRLQD